MSKFIAWFKNLFQTTKTEEISAMSETNDAVTQAAAPVADQVAAAAAAVVADAAPTPAPVAAQISIDTSALAALADPATTTANTVVTYTEAELAKAKAILVSLGHDLGDIFDDVLALAKKA